MKMYLLPVVRKFTIPAAAVLGLQCLSVLPAMAQDPVKVDAKHYKVEFENSQVRVLRITYGPHEKSVMHEHPANVAIFLTDGSTTMTTPDGKTTSPAVSKAGTATWDAGGLHLPENVGVKPFEVILVEMKGTKSAAK